MKKKVIIALAPMEASVPIVIDTLVKDIVDSVNAGASLVHLHARDNKGEMSRNTDLLVKAFERALTQADFVVQASTGGISDMTIEERCYPLDYKNVQSCSLNGGSMNLGENLYHNTFNDIRYVSHKAYKANTVPEIEVFDISMIQTMEHLLQDLPYKEPRAYNLVFGHRGGMEATINNLFAFKSFVPEKALWGVTHFGRTGWDFIAAAIAMGAFEVRIGFEDSRYLADDVSATRNVEVVARLKQLIESIGFEVATPKEAKEILNITK